MELIIEDQVNVLLTCAKEEGTEWGESIEPLCGLYHTAKYLSYEFYEAYKKELKLQYDYMLEQTVEVTAEERIVVREKRYRVWIE